MSTPRGINGPFNSDRADSKGDKQMQKPPKAVFGDLATAYSSITSSTRSGIVMGQASTNGDSRAARGFLLCEDNSQENPEDLTVLGQPWARDRPDALAPVEGAPLFRDEIGVDHGSMTDPGSESARWSTPVCDCDFNTESFPSTVDGEHLDTCATSRNDAVPEAIAVNTKQAEVKQFEPVAASTNFTRVRRSASVSDMGRHAADYPDSMYPGYGGASFEFDVAYDKPSRGFTTPNPKNANGMLPRPSSCGQYSSRTRHSQVPAGLGRADLTEDFPEGRNFVGNDPHIVFKSSSVGRIVQEYSGDDMTENFQDHGAHDQRAEYEVFENMTHYEAEEDEDEDQLEGGADELSDGRVGSDSVTCSDFDGVHGTSAPEPLASLEDTEPMLNDPSPHFDEYRFSQLAYSPQASDDGHSINGQSVDGPSVDRVETFSASSYQAPCQNTRSTLPSPPPAFPLPPSPPLCFQRQATPVIRDNCSTIGDCSRSSDSYGNTRNLLELSSPQRSDHQFRAYSASGHASPEKSNVSESAQILKSGREASFIKTSSESSNQFRVSILSPDGSLHRRPLSIRQARSLEAEIASHLRRVSDISTQSGHGSKFEAPNDHYTGYGRLSIDFSGNDNEIIQDLGPGGSQSSSSHNCLSGSGCYNLSAPRSGRIGRPGFYHDSLTSNTRDNSPDPMRGRARGPVMKNRGIGGSLSDTDSAGIMSDAHVYDDVQAYDDKDWETVAESQGFSRQGTQNVMGRRQTGSSLADYSDSGSLSPPKLAPLFSHRVLQHPPHPRYAPRSFGLLRDKQSGELVLMPEYTFTDGAGFPNRNALGPLTADSALNNPYQHPAPLSRDHAHPFVSSPPWMNSGRSVPHEDVSVRALRSDARNGLMSEFPSPLKYMKEDTYQARELQSSAQASESSSLPIKDGQRDVSLSTLGHGGIDGSYGSSAWLSTQNDAASVDCSDLPGRGGRFPKTTLLGRKANLTGTPDDTATTKVGSSLADDSSPGMKLSSSINHHTSSSPYAKLAPLEEQASSTLKLAKRYCNRTIGGTEGSTDVASGSEVYDRIRSQAIQRCSDLYDEDESLNTPEFKIPPLQVQKHRQHLIEHSLLPQHSSSSLADSGRLSAPLNHPKNQEDHDMGKIPGNAACVAIENTLASFSPSVSGTNARMRSPHRRVPSQDDDVYEARKLISFHETAPLSPPMPTAQIGGTSKQQVKSGLLGWKKQTTQEGDAYPMHSLNARSIKQYEGSLDLDLALANGGVSGSQAPIRVHPNERVQFQPRFGPDGRSSTRAESPHLYRIPHPATKAVLQRQRGLSIMVLCLCFLCPPTLVIYGHGLMDGVMEWLTHGQVNAFRPREKKVALVIGYGGSVLFILALVGGMVGVAMI